MQSLDRNASLPTQLKHNSLNKMQVLRSMNSSDKDLRKKVAGATNIQKAMYKLSLARSAFEQINHHRGLALTVKLASEFKKLKAASSKQIVTSKSLEPDRLGEFLDTASRVVVDSFPFNNEDFATLEALY